MTFDCTDLEILRLLQQDGRLKNNALAAQVSLSPSACLQRVRRLEGSGVIAGYRAIVDATAIGARFEAWIDLTLAEHRPDMLTRFASLLREAPTIVAAYQLAGPHDFLVHMVGGTIECWNVARARFIDEGIAIASARLSVVIDPIKRSGPIASPRTPPRLVRSVA